VLGKPGQAGTKKVGLILPEKGKGWAADLKKQKQ